MVESLTASITILSECRVINMATLRGTTQSGKTGGREGKRGNEYREGERDEKQ